MALRNEDGETVAVAETLRVRVRARGETLTTGVFTAALVVLLIAGIVQDHQARPQGHPLAADDRDPRGGRVGRRRLTYLTMAP